MLNLLQRRQHKDRRSDTADSSQNSGGAGKLAAAVCAAVKYTVMHPPVLSARWGVQNTLVDHVRRKKANTPDDK